MKSVFATLICISSLISCAQTPSGNTKVFPRVSTKPAPNEAVATFSEGCFWHAEIVFQSLVGVRDAVSGYAGGTATSPTYEDVASGTTGHAETVQVYYDPSKISYETLVKAYFASEDPTQVNGQGNDMGTEYRSIIFYRNTTEKQIVDTEIKTLVTSKKYHDKIVVQVVPFSKFYPAEDYHQEYIINNPNNPYVQHVSIPEYLNFKREFKGNFKS